MGKKHELKFIGSVIQVESKKKQKDVFIRVPREAHDQVEGLEGKKYKISVTLEELF
jgi:hypothetical protein